MTTTVTPSRASASRNNHRVPPAEAVTDRCCGEWPNGIPIAAIEPSQPI
ncbi:MULTISPECIES: hypothetical protein [Nocardia]|nr:MULTISPECIES: hypothetical protein [Nocardia]